MDAARLAGMTREDFEPCVGQRFRLAGSEPAFELALVRADELGVRSRGPGRQAPFALLFRGPQDPVLPQQIHTLEHPALGALPLFLVPVGRDEQGVRYEAIFN